MAGWSFRNTLNVQFVKNEQVIVSCYESLQEEPCYLNGILSNEGRSKKIKIACKKTENYEN